MSLDELKPEEKVAIAINMTDVCVRVCADGIRDRYPTISEAELIERVRERIMYNKKREREVQKLETFEGLIRRVVNSFNTFGLDYMFTGALAASYYGTPRTTMDLDIVVKVSREDLQNRLVPALRKAELQVNWERMNASFKSGFKIVTFKDNKTPFTVDIILSSRKLEKKSGTILDLPTFYQAPEELIMAKLRMIKATLTKERALKDMEDVRMILRFTEVDMNALKRRARRNNTLLILKNITAETTKQNSKT